MKKKHTSILIFGPRLIFSHISLVKVSNLVLSPMQLVGYSHIQAVRPNFPTRSKLPHPILFLINASSASIPIHLTNFKATNAIKSPFSSLNAKPKRKPQENSFSKPKKKKNTQNVNIIEGCSVAAASSLQLIGFPCPTFEEY